MKKSLALVFVCVACSATRAATINAASTSRADVNTAIQAASNGDTVVIPAGSSTWTAGVNLGTKGITVRGAGVGQTVLTSNISGSQTHMFTLNTQASFPTRFTGISFAGGSYDRRMFSISYEFGTQCFRIDHCDFTATVTTIFIDLWGDGPGLIDHCDFRAPDNAEMIHNFGYGSSSWTANVTPGGPDSLYIEDNTFTNNSNNPYFYGCSAVQAYDGARTVFRHNNLDFVQVDQHGTAGMIGARWWEIYENTFHIPSRSGIGGQDKYMDLRGGSGVVFNNHKTGGATNASIVLREEDSGYPALYQIGRGINQKLSPAYLWGNDSIMPIGSNSSNVVQNRDFYVSASKPSSLLRQQLGTDNSSTTYSYTPYTYPHPLASDTVTQPLPPQSPIISLSSGEINFGSMQLGTSANKKITVANIGGSSLIGTATTTQPFAVVSGSNYSLGSDQSQEVTVRYTPEPAGVHNGTVTFTGGGGASLALSGSALSDSASQPAVLPLSFESTAGSIRTPFAATAGYVSQSVETSSPSAGGQATYDFEISAAGNYTISAIVLAPTDGSNSFYINIDSQPTDPTMIWDLPLANSPTAAMVSWRGAGSPTDNEFLPKSFNLSPGVHKLIIRGREANTRLGKITISPSITTIASPTNLRVLPTP